jgi:hypothetical protein
MGTSVRPWREALALVGFYLMYVLFMKFNRRAETLVKGLLGQRPKVGRRRLIQSDPR